MSVINAIVPRYVIAKSINSLANPMDEFLKFKTECVDSDGGSSSNGSTTVGRKRKLDHLTVEEKIQRKKLKNRVAAQTSRDRKKAKMEEMESKIATQAKEIRTLTDTCKQLKKEKNDLEKVCKDLEARCEKMEQKMLEQQEKYEANLTSRVIGSTTKFNGSAVSYNPQQLELVAESIARNARNSSNNNNKSASSQIQAVLNLITLCIAYKTGSKDVTSRNLKNLPTAYWEILQQKLKKTTVSQQQESTIAFQDQPLIKSQWEPQPMEAELPMLLM